MSHWAIDYFGPLPADSEGNRYVLLAECCVTRWPEAIPVKSADVEHTAKALISHIFSRFGNTSSLQSDNGTHFINEVIDAIVRHCRLIHHRSTPYYPQSNGKIERMVGAVKSAIKRSFWDHLGLAEHDGTAKDQVAKVDWAPFLHSALWCIRSSIHSVTGVSPAFLVYGFDISIPSDPIPDPGSLAPAEVIAQRIKHISTTFPGLCEMDIDLRVPSPTSQRPQFSIGQHVWLCASASEKMPPVFTPRWKGPYVIFQILDKDVYRLRTDSRITGKRAGYLPCPVNAHRLRPFMSSDGAEIAELLQVPLPQEQSP